MAKAEATVEELVGMIQRGELRLPEMQRRYVWRASRVRDLLDSLYRGYPSGAILVWDTAEAVPLQDFAISQAETPYHTTRLLLDGQQRLTSLSAVLRGEPLTVRGRRRPIEILFNLEHPDGLAVVTEVNEDAEDDDGLEDEADSTVDELQERFDRMTFVVSTKKLEQLPQWVKVSEVLRTDEDLPFLKRAGVTELGDPRAQRYSKRLARLRGIKRYVYRMDVLERGLTYDEVTEIFVRVNSLGAKLRSSDLALAQITARWRGSLEIFQKYQAACEKAGFPLDLGLFLKAMVVSVTGQSKFQSVGSLDLQALQAGWSEATDGVDFALNFLKENCGIPSPVLLSSPFLVIVLAYYGEKRGYELGSEEAHQLARWALLANAKGRFSRGSSETLLNQDIAGLRDGQDVEALLERLRQQVGRLDVTPGELVGKTQRSALFKTMFLAFKQDGARDWKTKVAIASHTTGAKHKLEFHHVFPKAFLKDSVTSRERDDIGNLAFISAQTNKFIRDKAPAEYFPKIMDMAGEEAFQVQCIPTSSDLLSRERYFAFLDARRELISARLNRFLRVTGSTGERIPGTHLHGRHE